MQTSMARRQKPPPRIALPVVLLAAGMVGVGVWTAVQNLGGDGAATTTTTTAPALRREGSTAVKSEPFRIGEGPASYEIRYRVREPGRPVTDETVTVARPYDSRRTTATDVSETSFARLRSTPSKGTPTIVSPPPAAVDPRPGLVVERGVAEGLLQRREQRQVAGQRCQVFRARASVASSTIAAPQPGSYTESCLNAEGLVLEAWEVQDGRAVRQRLAIEVHSGPVELPEITGPPTLTAEQGGGSVLPVDPSSQPVGRFYELDAAPAGFVRRGRYSVIPPQAGLEDETQRRHAVASTADVYERGHDVLVVDRGGTLNLERAFRPRPEGRPVDLGPLFPEGELLLTWSGPEVRWGDEDGKFVRVYGTVPIDEVVAVARALRATTGGTGLVYLPANS